MKTELASASETRDLFAFDNSYARLPERFFKRLPPTPVAAPQLIRVNETLAAQLGLDAHRLASPDGVAVLAGNRVPEGADPIATAYAGHQFGGFVPQLGDGRAILLGEVIGRDAKRYDIQLKGAGPTPFSRRGDGRAALGPVLREYIVSEAMAALGIPTTRALAAVLTGEYVLRDTMLPGAVLTRVASSHIRVGTFQYFAVRRDVEALRVLVDYVIARHYPVVASAANPYRSFLDAVVARQARLVARWLLVGFIHGVMNTDNMSIAGETIDYGPCAFMDSYHPATVYSSIDQTGRYAYANQPPIAQWNLIRLAETLLPLLAQDEASAVVQAQEAINAFGSIFEAAYASGLCAKIGLPGSEPQDIEIAEDLLNRMACSSADFTLTFRGLAAASLGPDGDQGVGRFFSDPSAFDEWARRWRARLADAARANSTAEALRRVNPAFIPRNHQIQQAIAAAVNHGDLAPFNRLLAVLARPFDDQPDNADFAAPPLPEEVVTETFCGT